MTTRRSRRPRSGTSDHSNVPERVTLVASVAILVALLGGIAWLQSSDGSARPALDVTPRYGDAYQRHGDWYLPVEVTNSGDQPTDMVRIDLLQSVPGERPEVAELEFAFLAGAEVEQSVVVFEDRPSEANVTVDVQSYTVP